MAVIQTRRIKFHSPYPLRLHMKFGFDWPCGFWIEDVWRILPWRYSLELPHRGGYEAVLTSTHNLSFEQKYKKCQNFLSENFQLLVVKYSVHLNRHVFVMFIKAFTVFAHTLLSSRWFRSITVLGKIELLYDSVLHNTGLKDLPFFVYCLTIILLVKQFAYFYI